MPAVVLEAGQGVRRVPQAAPHHQVAAKAPPGRGVEVQQLQPREALSPAAGVIVPQELVRTAHGQEHHPRFHGRPQLSATALEVAEDHLLPGLLAAPHKEEIAPGEVHPAARSYRDQARSETVPAGAPGQSENVPPVAVGIQVVWIKMVEGDRYFRHSRCSSQYGRTAPRR